MICTESKPSAQTHRGRSHLLIMLVLLVSMMLPSGILAASRQVTYFKAAHSGLCLDVENNSNTAGARIQQWDCNNSSAQQFELVYIKGGPSFNGQAGNYYALRKAGTKMCIDIDGASKNNSARAILWYCHGGDNQSFLLYDYFWTFTPKVSLVNLHSTKCLDVSGASKQRGATIIQYDCHLKDNQRWYWNGK